MNYLIDDVARILATPMSRRKTFRLLGGALAAAAVAALGVQPVSAAVCTTAQLGAGSKSCGSGGNATCCPSNTCCAANGAAGAKCCTKGQCACNNGSCGASSGGKCGGGCTLCNAA